VKLAPRAPARRSETRELVQPIIVALNKLPGCRVARNNQGELEWAPGKWLRYGLGLGSSDIVGIVVVETWIMGRRRFGRVFSLEVKRHAARKAHKDTRKNQERWRAAVIRFGGFAGLIEARSTEDGIAQAVAAVERCRAGKSS
jgi:hypothetical protein